MKAELIEGGVFQDQRGRLRFANGFDLSPVKRMYMIRNSEELPFRGWIVHHHEKKWFWPASGKIRIYLVSLENQKVSHFDLDAEVPQVLAVSGEYALGIESQSPGAEVMVFSNFSIEESTPDTEKVPAEVYSRV